MNEQLKHQIGQRTLTLVEALVDKYGSELATAKRLGVPQPVVNRLIKQRKGAPLSIIMGLIYREDVPPQRIFLPVDELQKP